MDGISVAVVVIIGLFGLLIGSFLNVVIYRVPIGKSIVTPPSACPGCGESIKPHDNIPVVSWIMLRGRCRNCGEAISARYPIVELATGLLFAAAALRFTVPLDESAARTVSTSLVLICFLYFAAISVALCFIDLDTHKLPNVIVLPAYAVVAVLLIAASVVDGNVDAPLRAVIGGAAMFIAYFVMAVAYPGGMGFGDVKLAGIVGLLLGYVGWGALAVGGFSAFILGGLFGVVLLVMKRANRKSGIPFGPWMLAGAWLGIFIGERIWSGYLGLFQLV